VQLIRDHIQITAALEVILHQEAAIIVNTNHVVIISVRRAVNRQAEAIHLRAVVIKATHLHVRLIVVRHEAVILLHVHQVVHLAHLDLQALAVRHDQVVVHHNHQVAIDVRHQ